MESSLEKKLRWTVRYINVAGLLLISKLSLDASQTEAGIMTVVVLVTYTVYTIRKVVYHTAATDPNSMGG